jgi:tetratricopeptide (TPR) repeat protein
MYVITLNKSFPALLGLVLSRLIAATLLFALPLCCFSQVDTAQSKRNQKEQIEKAKQAQQKTLQQLKDMGIDIDPNKEVTEEEADKITQKLLKKGNEMQKQLQKQLPGKEQYEHKNIDVSKIPGSVQVVQIADHFFKRSYKQLPVIEKNKFDLDYKNAEKNKFSLSAVRNLTNKGAELITFGNDHHTACVYLAAAIKCLPNDTVSVNNFGAYLRIIDSVKTSLPVLLYANQLFSQSPVILTQIGCSLLELGDETKAEKYLKEALKYDPAFGEAHTALCEVYIRQHRLKEAIIELFAGVKGMGASYNQASYAGYRIQQQYDASDKNDFASNEEFWNETKKQLQPSDGGDVPGSEVTRVKMPAFPDCKNVEDWTFGGGYGNAVLSYASFHKCLVSSAEQFIEVRKQLPVLPADAVLRDYPNERFALDCITEMFTAFSKEEAGKYNKSIEDITQRLNDAREIYLKNHTANVNEYVSCLKSCPAGDDVCRKECRRQYCLKECPNANKFNETHRQAYKNYKMAFSDMVSKQVKLLDDLYAFANPWLAKISSPYWSRLYAYEVQRVALSIVASGYGAYPQPFGSPAMNECGEDCSIYFVPFTENPDDVNKNDPEGNNCDKDKKKVIALFFCELSWDCESVEAGCTEGVSASVKRNFKRGSTTLFVGVGAEAGLGAVKGGAKFGGQVTIGDDGSVDGGLKVRVTSTTPVSPKDGVKGAEYEMNLTVMKGLETEYTKVASPFSK